MNTNKQLSPVERELDAIFGKQAPKPGPPKPKPPVATVEPPEFDREIVAPSVAKPKFVRKPHLTNRPFVGHEGLQALQKSMQAKPTPRGQRRTNKEKK